MSGRAEVVAPNRTRALQRRREARAAGSPAENPLRRTGLVVLRVVREWELALDDAAIHREDVEADAVDAPAEWLESDGQALRAFGVAPGTSRSTR